MKSFHDGGSYFMMSFYKITQVPLFEGHSAVDDLAGTICEEAYFLSETGNAQTSVELLRVAGDSFCGEIKHLLVIRSYGTAEQECVCRQSALVRGVLQTLEQNGYRAEKVSYEQYVAIFSAATKGNVWALKKTEISECGLHNTYKSVPVLEEIDWKSIYAALDGSGCSLSVQVIPRCLNDEERRLIASNSISVNQASQGIVNMRDPLAESARERWKYYSDRSHKAMADVNLIVSGNRDSVARLVARIQASMSVAFESIPVADHSQFPIYNLPWQVLRNTKKNSFSVYAMEEVAVMMRFPRHGEYFVGMKENPFSLTPEKSLLAQELSSPLASFGIGETVYSGRSVFIPQKQFLLGTAIVGKTGSGKTTLLKKTIKDAAKAGIGVLIFEPVKREYRDLVSTIPESKIFTVERAITPFFINPFLVPKEVTLGDYRSSLLSAFKAAFSMPDPLPALFEKAISEAYMLYGWTDASTSDNRDVEVFDLHDFIRIFKNVIYRSDYSNEVKGNMMSGGAFRLQSLIERCPYTFDTVHATPVKDIFSGCAILEMGTLEPEQKILVTALTLIRILAVLKATGTSSSKLNNLIVIDEVHALLDPGKGVTEEEKNLQNTMAQLIINMITELRAYGVGVILADQAPSRIGSCILDNVDNLLAFRLSGKEAVWMQEHMGASENLATCLPMISAGEFFLKNRFLKEPLGIRVVNAPINNAHCTDKQIAILQRAYLDAHAEEYCPYTVCRHTCCGSCNTNTRQKAHMVAIQIFSECHKSMTSAETLASYIVQIPVVMKNREKSRVGFRELCECIAVHLVRICAVEKGISLSEDAVKKLLKEMRYT